MTHLILASCDAEYFRQFGDSFCRSAAAHGHPVHVNIINSQGRVELLEHPLVSYSFEEDAPATREYYASSRFLLAPKMLEALPDGRDSLLILDIDSIVRSAFELPDIAVGLYLRAPDQTKDEWVARGSRVAAGAVVYGRKGQAFARAVAARLQVLPQVWLVDQVALAETADAFKDRVRIQNLAEFRKFFDFHAFTTKSAIWSGKGRRKFDRAEYVEETERWRRRPLD